MRRFGCITAVGVWEGHKCLFKNRDRNYKPEIRIYHELVSGTEVLYLKDEVTGWCEGMNQYGIGIINSALAVGMDEKEKELTKKDVDGKTLRDGKRMLAALGKEDLEEALATIQTHDEGLRGHTIVANSEITYSLEATWEGHDYHVCKLPRNKNHVRTNHGLYHDGAGYTPKDGDSYLSSLARKDQAQKALRGVDKIKDIAPVIYGKRKKDLADVLNMVKLTEEMRTRSQAVMDLDALEMLVYILPGESKYLGYTNKLPKGHDPKLSLKVFEYTAIKDGDFEVKSRKANADASRVASRYAGGFRTLYYIGKRPASPKPKRAEWRGRGQDTPDWVRPWLDAPVSKGVFLTPNPMPVASNHGVFGHVYAYKVPEWVIKEAQGVNRMDRATEILIPEPLWAHVKFSGKSMDEDEFLQKVSQPGFERGVRAGSGGDCYEANGRYFMEHSIFPGKDKRLRLVHGEVRGQGPLDGVQYGHAWVEDGNTVIDVSNGRDIKMPKALYYAIGGIDQIGNMKRYTAEEFRKKVMKTENWGPWELKTSTGL
jgi:hypothetical protein